MDFDTIFASYYTQYRAEDTVPASSDPEYTIALQFANDAVRRWANYDATYWKELFENVQDAADGDKTLTTGDKTYSAPTNFKEAGGFIKIRQSGTLNLQQQLPIVDPQEVQFMGDTAHFCYFTGDVANGFVLNFNTAPDSSLNGSVLDYVYYKKPTEFSTGTDESEMSIPDFIVYHMLAHRFRASRNWSAYQTSKRDAEDSLRTMKMDNDSGNWANPWKVPDRSGSVWGA